MPVVELSVAEFAFSQRTVDALTDVLRGVAGLDA